MTQFRRDLVLFGTKSELPRISRFVEEACDGANLDAAARFDLQMAVDEACCNVFEHAYRSFPRLTRAAPSKNALWAAWACT
jgi:anti-sigma regulatory factor (Ser/Thr protein kinase)